MSGKLGNLLTTALQIVNNLGLDNLSVSLDCQSSRLRVRVECKDCAIKAGRLDGLAVSDVLLYLEDLDPNLPPKEMVKGMTVRVERLVLRVAAGLLNRCLDSDKARESLKGLPVEMKGLNVALAGERITVRGEVRKMMTFPFAVDLKPEAIGNKLRVVFENFWAAEMLPMPGWLRRLIMSIVNQKLAGKPELKGLVAITDDVITVNPWPKVPIKLDADLVRFGVEGHFLVLELGASSAAKRAAAQDEAKAVSMMQTKISPQSLRNAPAPQDAKPAPPAEPAPAPAAPQQAGEGDALEDMILPFIS